MTYIVGLSHLGINSILSDNRISYRDNLGKNSSLKSGILFPGCIFGSSGNVGACKDFLLAAKYEVGESSDTDFLWERFIDFVSFYQFPKEHDQEFQILLSTRYKGIPHFYELSSKKGLVFIPNKIYTLGSGKTIFDSLVYGEIKRTILQVSQKLFEENEYGYQKEFAHYLMAFLLTKISKGTLKRKIEFYGVGGIFHFIAQNGYTDFKQKPSLYLLCKLDNQTKTIFFSEYRVAFIRNWLTLNELDKLNSTPGQVCEQVNYAFLDETALPISPDLTYDPNKLRLDLTENAEAEEEKLPLYYFCGIGYQNHLLKDKFGWAIGSGCEVVTNEQNFNIFLNRCLGLIE